MTTQPEGRIDNHGTLVLRCRRQQLDAPLEKDREVPLGTRVRRHCESSGHGGVGWSRCGFVLVPGPHPARTRHGGSRVGDGIRLEARHQEGQIRPGITSSS